MARRMHLVRRPAQSVWLGVGAAFAAFYFGEAVLFWGPRPRLTGPAWTPLAYWGVFAATIVLLLRRRARRGAPQADPTLPAGLQSAILAGGITAAVVGLPLLAMYATGNVTLGHAILLGALCEAALVIGGLELNLGWLGAAAVWGGGLAAVWRWPSVQDYTLGAAVAVGFVLVGAGGWVLRRDAGEPA